MADISTLQQSLINAKRVMNKVDGGGFTKGGNNLTSSHSTQNINMESVQQHINMDSVQQHIPQLPTTPEPTLSTSPPNLNPKANMSTERINNSKLPDVIEEAMISTPIPDIPFNGGGTSLSDDFLSGVKTQMDKQGISTSIQPQSNIADLVTESIKPKTQKLSSKNLKSLIKESVKELLDEVVSTKINESIGLRTDMGENFQFRVGDKVFYGKITSTKTVK